MHPTEGPRSWREELTVSVEPGTRAGPLLLSISAGAAQTHCVLIIYCFSCSALIRAAAEVSPCTVFMSHITYLIFARCWSMKLLPLWAVATGGLDVARGRNRTWVLLIHSHRCAIPLGFWIRDAWFTHNWKSSPLTHHFRLLYVQVVLWCLSVSCDGLEIFPGCTQIDPRTPPHADWE